MRVSHVAVAFLLSPMKEFELRKHARQEGRRYCDPVVLTYQAERMPEQIRLKVSLSFSCFCVDCPAAVWTQTFVFRWEGWMPSSWPSMRSLPGTFQAFYPATIFPSPLASWPSP